jgi:hypothetical protein
MEEQKTFMQAMQDRHAAKQFDETKTIDEETIYSILEVGRLSPSSFGLEHWKFVVVESQELKEKLQEVSFNQKQVGTASHVVVFLAKKKDLRAHSQYVKDIFISRIPDLKIAEQLIDVHAGFVSQLNEDQFDAWCKKQCYIAAANMMTYAKMIGVDSCPMEGFIEEKVLEVLGKNKEEYGVALIVPFGYANDIKREKARLPFEKVVEFKR